jgi:hypothetical protein
MTLSLDSPLDLKTRYASRAARDAADVLCSALIVVSAVGIAVGPFTIGFADLVLPLAAWLGARRGPMAVRIVALAALPLIVDVSFGSFSLPGRAGLYAAAVIVCRLYGDARYRGECLSADRLDRRALAFLFLALACAVGYQLNFGDLRIWLGFTPYDLFYLLLFVIGLSRAPFRGVVVALAVASILGIVLAALAAEPLMGGFRVWYEPGSRTFLTGLIILWCGRLVGARLEARPRAIAPHHAPSWRRLTLSLINIRRCRRRG